MVTLHGKLGESWDGEPVVARVCSGDSNLDAQNITINDGDLHLPDRVVKLPGSLEHLEPGDVIHVSPRGGEVLVLYRSSSSFNTIFLREDCNSRCLSCPQPPKAEDDGYFGSVFLQAIPLMCEETKSLGITGGEPTLAGLQLVDIIASCEEHLPNTAVQVLTNARLLARLSFCQDIAGTQHHALELAVPIYSDIASIHDYMVQTKGAFDETIRGILNLQRVGIPVELRVLLCKPTIDRLVDIAQFVAGCLPFASHVAFMGMERMGFAKRYWHDLWCPTRVFSSELTDAVLLLDGLGVPVSLYNLPDCEIPEVLWGFARKSISDWKNKFHTDCARCTRQGNCSGLFASDPRVEDGATWLPETIEHITDAD